MNYFLRALLLLTFVLSGSALWAQTSLSGKIIDAENGEPAMLVNIALMKGGNLVTGTQTDFDGNYSISNLDPGTYNVQFSLVGYQTQMVEGVVVYAGKSNQLDASISQGVLLDEIVVVEYKVPLIEQDNTTQGGTLTSDQIKNLPTRNINALAATTAGLASADEGEDVTVRGSRSNATNFYVDGIRVQGNLIPESEIDQLQVITGGLEAKYGDVTGGIISITTKGPSSEFSGGIDMETSEFLDPYRQSLIGLNLSGPILKNKDNESILGFRLAGRFTYQYDDDPAATSVFRVSDEKLAEIQANPILNIGNSNLVAADFLTQEDVVALDASPYESMNRYDITGKIDARISDAIDVTFSGAYNYVEDQFMPAIRNFAPTDLNWMLLNGQNNPFQKETVYRGNFRFRHRLGNTNLDAEDANAPVSTIQNATYTLQFGYEKNLEDISDARHGDNYFDYGHVGNFDVEWIPTFTFDIPTLSWIHNDYRNVLRGYTPGTANPILANYNNAFGINPEDGINGGVQDNILFVAGVPQNVVGDILGTNTFIAPNGEISDQFDNSWGFHTNVGWVYNLARNRDDDIYTFNGRVSFDLLPGGSEKGRHSIEGGVMFEQRNVRKYDINPRNLWNVARQQVNNHIAGIPLDNPELLEIVDYIDLPESPETPIYKVVTQQDIAAANGQEDPLGDNAFFRNVRALTGQSLNEYVNIDGIDPSLLTLDLFSAKELNDEELLDYWGYDYLGNPYDGNFDDFFTTVDANGVRTFPVAPNRPIYFSGYIQDKFQFKDIIFRIGLRVDRYDANTKVLKDNYSIYEIQGASDFHANNPDFGDRPGNIGDDFKVYLNSAGSGIDAYRDGDQWYEANGSPANSAIDIEGIRSGIVNPAYVDPRAAEDENYIKSRDFDTNASFEDYEPQVNWMPRLAFSFPISNEANFFAHYDVLVQRPASNTIATARDYFYFRDEADEFKNNPNLKPERTIDYEVGFQQKLSDAAAIKIAAYYKEMRDMIQRRTFFPVAIINQYDTYDNIDFGTVKGFTFQFDKRRAKSNLSMNLNYTLQFADGTGSDSDSQRGLTSRGVLRNLFPLTFDERHRVVGSLDYRYGSGKKYNGPRVGGMDIFAKAGLNLQAIAVSGRPYTAKEQPLALSGSGTIGAVNGARLPWNFTLNLRIDKDFSIAKGLDANVYLRISNLLDKRNIISVYPFSGSATNDGFLQSAQGATQIQSIESSNREVSSYLASYQWRMLNPDLFSLPRRIFIGGYVNF